MGIPETFVKAVYNSPKLSKTSLKTVHNIKKEYNHILIKLVYLISWSTPGILSEYKAQYSHSVLLETASQHLHHVVWEGDTSLYNNLNNSHVGRNLTMQLNLAMQAC